MQTKSRTAQLDKSGTEVGQTYTKLKKPSIRKIEYQCMDCSQTLIVERSDKYYKATLPTCPLCGNSNWKIKEIEN